MIATLDSMVSFSALALLLAKSTLIVCLAFGGTRLLRRHSGAARHNVWALTMAVLIVVLAAAPFVPWKIDVPALSNGHPAIAPAAAMPSSARPTTSVKAVVTPAPTRIAPPSAAKRAVHSFLAVNWSRKLMWVWWLGIALVMAHQIVARVQLSRLSRRARAADDDSNRRFEQIAREAGIGRPIALLVSDEVDVPLTWGMFNARVLLPADFHDWEPRRFDNVLHHELAHVRRLDVFTAFLADVVCALYWYNPLVWRAATQMRVEREIACDEAVLATGARASDYATDLVDLAVNVRFGSLHRAGLAIAGCPRFEQRVKAIVAPGVKAGLTRFAAAAVVVGALAVLPLLAFQIGQATKYPTAFPTYPVPPQKVLDFQQAAVAGQLEIMVKMAVQDPSMINVRGREGQTALTQALSSVSPRGRDEALWLVAHGAEINVEQLMGTTPLMLATRYPDVLQILLDRGANIEAADSWGRTALDFAILGHNSASDDDRRKALEQSLKLLRDKGAKLSFIAAIRLPDIDTVRQYLADDPSLVHQTWPGAYGGPALMQAVVARRNSKDSDVYQPVVDLIASYLPEPTLCEAAMLGRTDLIAKELDRNPAYVNTPPAYVNKPMVWQPIKPLDCALIAGERGTVQFLLNHGAKLEGIPQIREALYADADTVRLLLSFGAGKDVKPYVFEDFAKMADRMGKKEIADVLRAQK